MQKNNFETQIVIYTTLYPDLHVFKSELTLYLKNLAMNNRYDIQYLQKSIIVNRLNIYINSIQNYKYDISNNIYSNVVYEVLEELNYDNWNIQSNVCNISDDLLNQIYPNNKHSNIFVTGISPQEFDIIYNYNNGKTSK